MIPVRNPGEAVGLCRIASSESESLSLGDQPENSKTQRLKGSQINTIFSYAWVCVTPKGSCFEIAHPGFRVRRMSNFECRKSQRRAACREPKPFCAHNPTQSHPPCRMIRHSMFAVRSMSPGAFRKLQQGADYWAPTPPSRQEPGPVLYPPSQPFGMLHAACTMLFCCPCSSGSPTTSRP